MNGNDEKSESKVNNFIKFIMEYILFVLFALMVVFVFGNVVARFVFDSAITSSEEIARFCLIWLVYIGVALALAQDEHLGFDIVVNLLPRTAKKWVAVLSNILMLFIIAMMTVYGVQLSLNNIGWPSPALGIPYGVINLILPVSSAFMFLIVIQKTVFLLKKIKKGR